MTGITSELDKKMRDIVLYVKEKGICKAYDLCWDYGISIHTLLVYAMDYGMVTYQESIPTIGNKLRWMVRYKGDDDEAGEGEEAQETNP